MVPISHSNRQPSFKLFRYRIVGFDARKGPKGPGIPTVPRRHRGNLRFRQTAPHIIVLRYLCLALTLG
jgi:hypothetical protein